jgi:cysteine desulfurase
MQFWGGVEPSRVLLNMGLPKEVAASSIRFSVGRHNTVEEIDRALEIIEQIVAKLAMKQARPLS